MARRAQAGSADPHASRACRCRCRRRRHQWTRRRRCCSDARGRVLIARVAWAGARRVGRHAARRRRGRGLERGGGRGLRARHGLQLVHDRPDRTPTLTLIPAPALTLSVALSLSLSPTRFTTDPITGAYDDGAWWDASLVELCAPYDRVCLLGESMGGSAALRFARHATPTGSVVALAPQIDLRDFSCCGRVDFCDDRRVRLRLSISMLRYGSTTVARGPQYISTY